MAGPVKKYNVSAVVAEARLKKPAIILTGLPRDSEAEFRVDPPELWPDEVQDLAAAGKATEVTKFLLGDQYEAFIDAGGSNAILNLVLTEHRGSMLLGESSASSDS